MAAAPTLRCFFSRPDLSVALRPSANPLLLSLNRSPGVPSTLQCRNQKIMVFVARVSMLSQSSPEYRTSLHSTEFSALEQGVQNSKSDILQQLIDLSGGILVHLNYYKIGTLFSFPRIMLMSCTSMMILPCSALAGTCESNNSLFNMPLLFAISFIGAVVGGLLARQRRGELKKLNEQLRQINAALRRQAKIESYAPNLSYAPSSRVAESEIIVDPRREELIEYLRSGKNYLRNQEPERAFAEFQKAFELAGNIQDHVERKKAARGLGASLQRQGKYREAIKYHSKVLEIAKRSGEDSGSTEAYGAIADCYTELGDLERAAKFYDKYIARLEE